MDNQGKNKVHAVGLSVVSQKSEILNTIDEQIQANQSALDKAEGYKQRIEEQGEDCMDEIFAVVKMFASRGIVDILENIKATENKETQLKLAKLLLLFACDELNQDIGTWETMKQRIREASN